MALLRRWIDFLCILVEEIGQTGEGTVSLEDIFTNSKIRDKTIVSTLGIELSCWKRKTKQVLMSSGNAFNGAVILIFERLPMLMPTLRKLAIEISYQEGESDDDDDDSSFIVACWISNLLGQSLAIAATQCPGKINDKDSQRHLQFSWLVDGVDLMHGLPVTSQAVDDALMILLSKICFPSENQQNNLGYSSKKGLKSRKEFQMAALLCFVYDRLIDSAWRTSDNSDKQKILFFIQNLELESLLEYVINLELESKVEVEKQARAQMFSVAAMLAIGADITCCPQSDLLGHCAQNKGHLFTYISDRLIGVEVVNQINLRGFKTETELNITKCIMQHQSKQQVPFTNSPEKENSETVNVEAILSTLEAEVDASNKGVRKAFHLLGCSLEPKI